MKKIVLIIICCISVNMFAQTNKTDGNGSNISGNLVVAANGANIQAIGAGITFFNPEKNIEGSKYLYDDWNSMAVIYAGDRKFQVKNMNLNLETNTFESKFTRDSIFTFNFNNIDKFVINNKSFSSYYHDGENKVFESIYTGNGIEILRHNKLKIIKGSDNPMLNRSQDKYVKKAYYYVKKGDVIESAKLKRKSLMSYIDDKEQVDKILDYIKNNN